MEADDVIEYLFRELLIDLGEGNPGAISVLRMMLQEYPDDSFEITEKLVRHQIKGSDMWVLFKQKEQNIHTFVNHVKSLD
jgi:hypothetical protein